MKYHRYSRRASKALAVGFVLGLGVLAPTAAASPVYTNPPLVNPGTGTLYITKLYSPTQPTQDNGEPNTTITSTNTPVPGVVFSVQQVLYNGAAIDLTSPDGWAQAAAAQALFGDSAPSGSGYSLQLPATSCTTTATGACNLPLPLGLYYVQETTTPSGVTASAPFYVTLPMTNTAGDGWISDGSGYAVYVYPKNDKVNASKTASAPTTPVAGGQITYTVTSDIPEDVDPVSGQVLVNAYVVTDTLDSRLNLPTAANVVVSITNPGGAPAPVVLTQGTDYSVTLTGSTNTVQVTFLAPGLAKLSAAGQSDLTAGIPHGSGHEVQVTFPGTVNSTLNTQGSTAAGDIPNTANVYPDQNHVNSGTGITTNQVDTYYGGVNIHKQDGSSSAPLAGATFQIYASATDAAAGTNMLSAQNTAGAVATSFTTDSTGEVGILGLNYDPVAGNCTLNSSTTPAVSPAMTGNYYWIVETVAPTGYELQTDPIQVCVVGVLDGAGSSYDDWIVNNVSHNAGFDLPFTGLFEGYLWPAVGAFVVAGGLAVYVIRYRKAATIS